MNVYRNLRNGKLYQIEYIMHPKDMFDWEKIHCDKTPFYVTPYKGNTEQPYYTNCISDFIKEF